MSCTTHRAAGVITLALALVACNGAATAAPTSRAAASTDGMASMDMTQPATFAAGVSMPGATQSGPVRCAITPNAIPSATIDIIYDKISFQFGDPVTIKAGQAVLFQNGNNAPHTVTEGVDGQKADNACVDVGLATGAAVIVTFTIAGDYKITCKPHPPMETVVHVE